MSSSKLGQVAQAAVDELKKDVRGEELNVLPFNLLGFSKKVVTGELLSIFSAEVANNPVEATDIINTSYDQLMAALRVEQTKQLRKMTLIEKSVLTTRRVSFQVKNKLDNAFIVGKYTSLTGLKGRGGTFTKIIEENFNKIKAEDFEERLSLLGGSNKQAGFQLEHGGGAGAASSTIKASRAKKAALAKAEQLGMTRQERTQIDTLFAEYENDMQISLDRVYKISSTSGLFKVAISPTLLFGKSVDNQLAQKLESRFINYLRKGTKSRGGGLQGIIESEGSPSVPDALGQTIVTAAVGKKGSKKKKITTEKPLQATVAGKTKGKSKKVDLTQKLQTTGVSNPKIFPRSYKRRAPLKKEKGPSAKPFALMAEMNRQLPAVVAKNMGAPGLENQTGRFARSVRITDVAETTGGFPSFGYTYQKNPYQVYEQGKGRAPWATAERDPRKLIDRSMREIAAQYAVGRFYTRRV